MTATAIPTIAKPRSTLLAIIGGRAEPPPEPGAYPPKCPECDGDIATVSFVARQEHRFLIDVDDQSGAATCYSEHHATFVAQPDWVWRVEQGRPVCEVEVQCAEGHSWLERRLTAYRYDRARGSNVWTVVP